MAASLLSGLSEAQAKKNPSIRQVRSGDTIYSLMRNAGFSDEQRGATARANILPSNFVLSLGDQYMVSNNSGRVEMKFFDKHKDIAYLFWREARGTAGASKVPAYFTRKVLTAQGTVQGSILQSIANKVGDELVAYRFLDAYVLEYNLQKSVERGAPFKITYEKLYDGQNFIRFGEVLRTEIFVGGRKVVRQLMPLDGGAIFVGPNIRSDNRMFYAPVDTIRVSSLFQPRRYHPIRRFRRAHEGIDFEQPEGANVYAVQSGTVLRIGRNRAAGKFVVLRHANGYESYYNHLSAHNTRLRAGSRVNTGERIGLIGTTGYSTKPHLHFAVKKYGRFIDPVFLVRGYAFHQRTQASRLIAKVTE